MQIDDDDEGKPSRTGIWRQNPHRTLMSITASIGNRAKRRFRCAAQQKSSCGDQYLELTV